MDARRTALRPQHRLASTVDCRRWPACTCAIDGVLEHSPAGHVRRPPGHHPVAHARAQPPQFEAVLHAAKLSPNTRSGSHAAQTHPDARIISTRPLRWRTGHWPQSRRRVEARRARHVIANGPARSPAPNWRTPCSGLGQRLAQGGTTRAGSSLHRKVKVLCVRAFQIFTPAELVSGRGRCPLQRGVVQSVAVDS
jgi:hypothetical protein